MFASGNEVRSQIQFHKAGLIWIDEIHSFLFRIISYTVYILLATSTHTTTTDTRTTHSCKKEGL